MKNFHFCSIVITSEMHTVSRWWLKPVNLLCEISSRQLTKNNVLRKKDMSNGFLLQVLQFKGQSFITQCLAISIHAHSCSRVFQLFLINFELTKELMYKHNTKQFLKTSQNAIRLCVTVSLTGFQQKKNSFQWRLWFRLGYHNSKVKLRDFAMNVFVEILTKICKLQALSWIFFKIHNDFPWWKLQLWQNNFL